MESGPFGWFDVVIEFAGDGWGLPWCHHHVEGRAGVCLEADLASLDLQEAPPLGGDTMSPSQGIGHQILVRMDGLLTDRTGR